MIDAHNTDPQLVLADLQLIVGGGFHVDAIGPDQYAEVTARVAAAPNTYVSAFERQYLGANFDPKVHARIHATVLVDVLKTVGSDAYRELAHALLRHYDGALLIYDHAADKAALSTVLPERTVDLLVRLDDRRKWLQAALGPEG